MAEKTTAEQLRDARKELARLKLGIRKKKAAAKRKAGWQPPFPGAHRGY